MPLTLRELKGWAPEIEDLAKSSREAAAGHTNSADFYRSLIKVSTWEGQGADSAQAAMEATARDHDAVAENLGKAATRMEHIGHDAETLAETINGILDDAAAQPVVQINETTNEVVPPSTDYLDEDAAARVAAKVSDLQTRIAAALADGERVDADLAGAISAATGSEPVVKTASSLEDLLLPDNGERNAPAPGEPATGPDSLDGALDQLTGMPGHPPAAPQPGEPTADAAGDATAPVRLDPAKVEQFKTLARQALQRDGVPADQIEARLDAMVAAAQQPLKPYTAPEPDKMPPPGFGEGFADRWFDTEQGIKELLGQGGPGAPGVLESWRDLITGTNEQLTNPVGTAIGEVERALESPSAAYYLGEKSADAAVAAPGVIFGGEGALVARAGVLDDLARPGAIPHDVIDPPTQTGTIHHSAPPSPIAVDHPAPVVGDHFGGYSPDAPGVASNLNDSFVHGQPTTDLAREVADLSTHHIPSPTPDFGGADRVVLGKWDGQDRGYIGEARTNGGIYFDTGDTTWDAVGHGLSDTQARSLGWQVNEQFLRTQLENGVPRIEYVLPDGFDSVEQLAAVQRRSFSALEINFLKENAAVYGYKQYGSSWVYEGGN